MINAIKLISINKGEDPRDYSLIAFGGGGGMHGPILARELGIKQVVVPRYSSVFSAWGMLMSDIRRDVFLTQLILTSESDAASRIQQSITMLEEQIKANNPKGRQIRFERFGSFQYEQQTHTSVEVPIPNEEIT
jgi:N-methylhydantoinase A